MIHFLKNGASFLKKRQEDVLSAAFVIAVSVALSTLLGLVKWRLLASYFGTDIKQLDSFIAASKLTDSIFEVMIFGTIALAFIPVFSKYLSKEKLEKAWEFASTMISLGFIIFFVLAVLIFILAPYIAPWLAPGLVAQDPLTKPVIARLLRIMMLAQIFFVVSIFFTGILQSFQRFVVPALASVFYNIGIILSIIFLVPVFGIYAPAIGMIFGALLHLIIQLPLIYSLGFKFKFNFNFANKDVKETLSLMVPRSLALGVIRLSDLINIALASITAIGSVSAFNFAQILQFLPITIFASSIAQAALPSLSLQVHAQRNDQFKKVFTESLHQIIFLVLPIAAILAVLRIPAVRLVFGAGELPWNTTVLAGRVLIAFSIGIAAQAAGLLITRAFYALRDSVTPVKINIATTTLNISLSLYFILVLHLSLIYLAIAYSTSTILNAIILLYFLDRKIHLERKAFALPIVKMIVISLITAIALYIPMKLLDQLVFDTTRTIGLVLLTGIAAGVGLTVYVLLSWVFNIEQFYIFFAFAKRVIALPAKMTKPHSS